jgi:metallo-beta-lactamase class B
MLKFDPRYPVVEVYLGAGYGQIKTGYCGDYRRLAAGGAAAACADEPRLDHPIAPFHIAGNLYYVGGKDLASYLIVTPQGNILINSNLQGSTAMIRASVEQLGFKFKDIKVLLVMDGDVSVVESGGATDFAYAKDTYAPAKVNRILHDGDAVKLGGTVLIAHKTAGHTRGCTTWTMQVKEAGVRSTLSSSAVGM